MLIILREGAYDNTLTARSASLLGIIFFGFLSFMAWHEAYSIYNLYQHGKIVKATVISLHGTVKPKGRPTEGTLKVFYNNKHYYIDVTENAYYTIAAGDSVTVRYSNVTDEMETLKPVHPYWKWNIIMPIAFFSALIYCIYKFFTLPGKVF